MLICSIAIVCLRFDSVFNAPLFYAHSAALLPLDLLRPFPQPYLLLGFADGPCVSCFHSCTLLVSFTPTNSIDFFLLVYILDRFYFTSGRSELECTNYLTLTVNPRFARGVTSYYLIENYCIIFAISSNCPAISSNSRLRSSVLVPIRFPPITNGSPSGNTSSSVLA